MVATEFNACVKFSLLEADESGPSAVTYGFAATCNNTTPVARTKVPIKKIGKDGNLAAGIKIKLPSAIKNRPAITVYLYPILSISFPAGIDIIG